MKFKRFTAYANKLNEIESKKHEKELEDFVRHGNVLADFDPSDIDSDEDEGIEEENPMEDVMGDDDIKLLEKIFSLPQRCLMINNFEGRVRKEHRKQTFGRKFYQNCESVAQVSLK